MYKNFRKKFFSYEKFSQNFSEIFDDFLKIFFSWIGYFTSKIFNNFGQYTTSENSTCKIKDQKSIMGKIFKSTFLKTHF